MKWEMGEERREEKEEENKGRKDCNGIYMLFIELHKDNITNDEMRRME